MKIRVYRHRDSVVVTPDGTDIESYLSPMQAEELAARLVEFAINVRATPPESGLRSSMCVSSSREPAPLFEREEAGAMVQEGKVMTARRASGGELWTVWKFREGYKARPGPWSPHDGSGSVPTLEEALSIWGLRKED